MKFQKWEFGVVVKVLIIYKTSEFPLLLFTNIQGNDLVPVGCRGTPIKPVWVGVSLSSCGFLPVPGEIPLRLCGVG